MSGDGDGDTDGDHDDDDDDDAIIREVTNTRKKAEVEVSRSVNTTKQGESE